MMRVNVYAEEMTDQVEIIEKEIDGHVFTGLRIYLHLPVTRFRYSVDPVGKDTDVEAYGDDIVQSQGPFIHRLGDDDSSAVTFWGEKDLRDTLRKAIEKLDDHYLAQKRARQRAVRMASVDTDARALDPEQHYFLRKGGFWYRHDARGYTASLLDAGTFDDARAQAECQSTHGEVEAVALVDAIDQMGDEFNKIVTRVGDMKRRYDRVKARMG